MSYQQYYTSSDVFVFLINPTSNKVIQLDQLSGIGWSEGLTSSPFYGLGQQVCGFINEGNLEVFGSLELNFTHDDYLRTALNYIMPNAPSTYKEDSDIQNSLNMSMQETQAVFNDVKRARAAKLKVSGILNLPEGFKIQVVFNNSNLYSNDTNKVFTIHGSKIVGQQMMVSTTTDGQIIHSFKFLAKEVI